MEDKKTFNLVGWSNKIGFKCPVCLEDFGVKKKLWENHLKVEHSGLAEDCVKTLKSITKKPNQKEE